MAGAAEMNGLDVARVVSTTFATFRRHLWTFLALSAAFVLADYTLNFTLKALLRPAFPFPGYPYWTYVVAVYGIGLFVQVFSSAPYYWLHAVIAHSVIADLRETRLALTAALRATMRDAVALGAIGIVSMILVSIGFTLLLVPGIALNLVWFVLAPVRAIERPRIRDTFRRSQFLTSGQRLRILGPYLIILVLESVPPYLFGFFYMALPFGNRQEQYWLGCVLPIELIKVVTTAISATFVAVLYYELRTLKEGAPPEDAASVFD